MAFQLSPGVNVSEIDLTTVVPSVATSTGAFAGKFTWGPVNEIVTISDEVRLAETFGKPTDANYEDWFSAANFLAYSNNLKVVRAANSNTTIQATTTGFKAKYPGELGNSIRVEMADANTFNEALGTVDGDELVANVEYTITVSGNTNWTSVGASSNNVGTVFTANGAAALASPNGTATYVISTPWKYANEFTSSPATSDYVLEAGGANDEVHIIVIDEGGKFTGVANTILEKFSFVSRATDAKTFDGSTNYYANVLESRSKYIVANNASTYSNTSNISFDSLGSVIGSRLANGSDGTINNNQVIAAYDYFVNSDTVDISLIITGPANSTVTKHIIDNIAEVRKDCVVFCSPPKTAVVDKYGQELSSVLTYRNTTLNVNSSYAVMDTGWKYQYDKYNDLYRWIPLNGDIAGLAARTDRDRDPWYSPAGLTRGIVKNVIKLAWNPNKAERDDLYSKGINPVVTFTGEGTLLYGDKTLLSRPSAFDRINVRRLFIVLEKAIARAARSSLFEFNDQFTRAQFVNLVEPFLRDVQGRRGITDFRVVCDETNNTGEVIDRNEFIGDIYIKPARSINFIQLNFVAVRTGVSFEEVVGRFG